MVDETIRTYYELVPAQYCADCGKTIMPTSKRTVADIVAGSTAKFGRILCSACAKAVVENESAQTVSE